MLKAIEKFDFQDLQQTVQHNCAISDARYSREYSLCIYLLRLREFYRWQKNIPFGEAVDQQDLATWVSETEARWDEIEETDFLKIKINDQRFDPFDTAEINKKLYGSGMHYGAGFGRLGQPHFILAKLNATTSSDNYTCVEYGEELARDSITLPAIVQHKAIVIRQESFTELLWQMLDEWRLHKVSGPMARLVEHYNLKNNVDLYKSLSFASSDLTAVLKNHEMGEIAAGELLGDEYQQMTFAFNGRAGEMQIRAVRDLLADALRTWPLIEGTGITDNGATPYLDFWLAGLNGYREKFFNLANPDATLFSMDAGIRYEALVSMISTEQLRWHRVCASLLDNYRKQGIKLNVEKSIMESLGATP